MGLSNQGLTETEHLPLIKALEVRRVISAYKVALVFFLAAVLLSSSHLFPPFSGFKYITNLLMAYMYTVILSPH